MSEGRLFGTSGIAFGIRSSPEGSWILGEYPFPENFAVDAVIFGEPEILQPLH